MTTDIIDITGLDKGAVFAALYNAAKQRFLHAMGGARMSVEEAAKEYKYDCSPLYLNGRAMCVGLGCSQINVWTYNHHNGEGAAHAALAPLLEEKEKRK